MNIAPSPVLLRIILTYEELSLVLKLMNAATLPGLKPPQTEPLTPEQEVQGLLFAERSLRARELARRTADNHLVVHAALLSAVGACAYADQVVIVQHIRANGEVIDLYGSVQDELVVAHTLPEPGLHQLSVLEDIAALATQALAACGCESLQPASGGSLTVTDEALRQTQELAQQGALREATARLVGAADAPFAAALVEALSAPHAVSIFLFLRRQADGTIVPYELSVLHTAATAWLFTQLPQSEGVRRVAPVTTRGLLDALMAELKTTPHVTVSA